MKRTPLKRSPMKTRSRPSKAEFHPSVRGAVERRSGGRCEAGTRSCVTKATMFHHIKLRSQGGAGTVENALHVCGPCHTFIHANPSLSYEHGWMVRSSTAVN